MLFVTFTQALGPVKHQVRSCARKPLPLTLCKLRTLKVLSRVLLCLTDLLLLQQLRKLLRRLALRRLAQCRLLTLQRLRSLRVLST
jgi:hypothetical protein